ncbi:MAG: outer membrane protein assembly factor BamA [Xanthomonadales bacterium]|nr:outer membrane protein assembly factor BamA [Xanthomonadales bacterium]
MKKIILSLFFLVFSYSTLSASTEFVISDIRVEGLQRITEGTVFNYLPLETDDRLTSYNTRSAIRELYKTGFFEDVQVSHDGTILIITVKERPAISEIDISGNKALKTDDLMVALHDIGLSEGDTFDQLALDRVQQELVKQYYSQGKYAVKVSGTVSRLDRNRVRVSINIDEGKNARVRHLNIVGNTLFTEKELREAFETATTNWTSFWTKDDQYAREKLSGDTEILRSYYQDRGYVDFDIESTQVSISPNKRDIYVTANIHEGEQYTVKDIKLAGDMVVQEATLRRLIMTNDGDIFSRSRMERSVENISAILANVGYAFANVSPSPEIDRENRTVSITYFVDPGKRVYVRRVLFAGNTKTKDEVLRRELRQFEGAWFSQASVDRTKIRLQRLTYFDEVNIETPQVPGSEDQVDVIVNVKERPSGSFSAGLGFSQVQGLILSLAINQDNFLGSGNKVGMSISNSAILTQVSLSYTNPYWTDNGISRGFFIRYSDFDQRQANIASFTSSEGALGVNFGFPVSEVDYVGAGLSYRDTSLNIGTVRCIAFNSATPPVCTEFGLRPIPNDPLSNSLDANGNGVLENNERELQTIQGDISWSRDSRDHFLNPNRGSLHRLSVEVAIPGSSREYYKLNYRFAKYLPIWRSLIFAIKGNVGYGDSYDNYDRDLVFTPSGPPVIIAGDCDIEDVVTLDSGLPFWEHFYAGGVRDVRGFNDNTLGPKDQFCRAVGGDFKTTGTLELAFPTPFLGGRGGTRLALFLDVGNAFENISAWDADRLRASAGISMTWQAPVGPIIINLAYPILEKPGDDTETLQFSFGAGF